MNLTYKQAIAKIKKLTVANENLKNIKNIKNIANIIKKKITKLEKKILN